MHPFMAEQLVAVRRAEALAAAHHSRLVRAVAANRSGGDRARFGPRWRYRPGTQPSAGVGFETLVTNNARP